MTTTGAAAAGDDGDNNNNKPFCWMRNGTMLDGGQSSTRVGIIKKKAQRKEKKIKV